MPQKITALAIVAFLLVGITIGVSIPPLNATTEKKAIQPLHSFSVTLNNQTLNDTNLKLTTDAFSVRQNVPATIIFSIQNTGILPIDVAFKIYSDGQIVIENVGNWNTLQPNETTPDIIYCLSLGTIPINATSADAILSFVGTPTETT